MRTLFRRLFRADSRGSLAIACLLSVPLYLAALLAVVARARQAANRRCSREPPSSSTEATIWASRADRACDSARSRHRCGAAPALRPLPAALRPASVVCFVLPGLAHGWIGRHERRFPLGIDFVKDSSPSNLSSRGDWEHASYDTIVSITHWTLVLAFGAIAIGILLEVRRRRGADAILVAAPPGEPTGGAPELTGPS